MSNEADLHAPWQELLARARLRSMQRFPYFATALLQLQPQTAPGLGTLAVDDRWRLYVDPEVLQVWGQERTAGALLHEVMHLLRGHHDRAPRGADSRHRWNVAADLEINDDLDDAGVALPDGVVLPERFGLARGSTAEQFFHQLGDGALPPVECGSCVDGDRRHWESNDASGVGPSRAASIRDETAAKVRSSARGTVPAGLIRWAEARLAVSIPWQRVLAAHLKRGVAAATGTTAVARWDRPLRRRPPGPVLLPSMSALAPRVAVVVDTSASVDDDLLGEAVWHIERLVAHLGRAVDVVSCDSVATVKRRQHRVDGESLVGGGGTDLRVGIRAAASVRPAPNIIVVLTDGETPWPDRPPSGARVIAVLLAGEVITPVWVESVVVPSADQTSARYCSTAATS